MRLPFSLLRHTFFLVASASVLLYSTSAMAADQVILKYKIFRESVSVDELKTLGETGEVSSELRFYLKAARQEPEAFRKVLTQELTVSPIVLDRVLNNPLGEFLLDQISEAVHTPSGQANRQALRSALVLSASQDKKITLLEIIQKYPTSEVEVESERLLSAYRQLNLLTGPLKDLLTNHNIFN